MHGRKPDPIDAVVGARIRFRRKVASITQQTLAEALGITFQQVQKYERGTNRVSASMLVKIARKLDCPVSYLLAEAEGDEAKVQLTDRLSIDGAVELLELYAGLDDAKSRAAVLGLARALTGKPAPARGRAPAPLALEQG